MKIGRYTGSDGSTRLGVIQDSPKGLMVLDLLAAAAAQHGNAAYRTMEELIDAGARGLEATYRTIEWAHANGEDAWLQAESATRWLIPLEVRNCVATGRNFAKHVAEARGYWEKQGVPQAKRDIPTGFIKLTSALVPTRTPVARPADVELFDYEVEACAVISRSILNIKESEALGAVWGYTVFNDLSAREWQRREMANQLLVLGKNFPAFGPLGPWILTADEVPDPAKLELRTTVNGEQRQHSTCESLIFNWPEMIAHWSRLGLTRGDLVSSGTPEGVATGRKEGETPWWLKPGDVVRVTVDQIGTLETPIV